MMKDEISAVLSPVRIVVKLRAAESDNRNDLLALGKVCIGDRLPWTKQQPLQARTPSTRKETLFEIKKLPIGRVKLAWWTPNVADTSKTQGPLWPSGPDSV